MNKPKDSSQDAELAVHGPRQRSFFKGAANKKRNMATSVKAAAVSLSKYPTTVQLELLKPVSS